MAIDIIVRDNIDASIETRFNAIALVAERLEKRVESLQKSLGRLNAGGLNSVAKNLESRMGSLGRGGAGPASTGRRTYESAFVTAQKQQNATRQAISKVFTDGFNAQEKQRIATARSFDRSAAAQERAANRQAARLARVENASVTAARELQAKRDAITKAFEQGFAARANRASAATSAVPQLAAPKNMRNYVDQTIANSRPSSIVVRQQQQQLYNGLFGANNLTTSASQQWSSTLSNIVSNARPSSAATRAARQSMYNNLFSAVPAAPTLPTVNTGSVSANALRAAAAQNRWTQSTNNTASAMQRLEHSVGFLRSDGLRWAKVLWALGGATLTAGAIVAAADAYTRLQNRLSVVAESQQHVNSLTDEMLRISTASRQPIEETAKTFTRFDLAMQQAGRSQSDTIRLTENVAKALKLGGATAGEAASALLQLSQAFNKGKLDGDEFRSVMENSPILVDELAKSMKVTRGELLKLAPEGKITAKIMADAWIGATDRINAAFDKLKPTIAESFTVLRSNAIVFFGRLDEAIGFTAALSKAIIGLSANLDVVAFAFMALAPIVAFFVGSQLIAGFGVMLAYMGRTAIAVGAIRSPITVVAAGLANMARLGAAAGTSLVTAFNAASTRGIMLQLTLVRVTAGVLALGAAAKTTGLALLGMFSFGNIVLVLGVAVAAAMAFGDQLIINAENGVTMRDKTVAVFQEIGAFAKDAFITVYDAAVEAFGGTTKEGETLGEKLANTFFAVGLAAAVTVDAISTVFSNLLAGVKSAIYFIGDAIYNVIALGANAVVSLVNGAIESMNTLTSAANSILNWTGASSIVGEFGAIGYMAGMAYKDQFKESLSDFGRVTAAGDAFMEFNDRTGDRAAAIAQERKKTVVNSPRTAAASTLKDKDKKKKEKKPKKSDEEKRADIIAKVVNAEKSAIVVSTRLGDERERLNVIEELNNKLKEKGYAQLSLGAAGEREMIDRLVQQRVVAERVGEAMQEMYQNSINPLQDYATKYKALENLLAQGHLTADQYAASIRGIKDAFDAASDPSDALAKQIAKLNALQGLTGDSRETAGTVYDMGKAADANGQPFNSAAAEQMLTQIKNAERAIAATEDITARTTTALTENSYALTAQHEAYREGAISVGMYTREVAALMVTQGQLADNMFGLNNGDPFEPMRRGLYQLVSEMPTLGQSMSDAISSTLGNAINNLSETMTEMILDFDGYAESVADALQRPVSTLEVMRYALADIINQVGKELLNAVIKMGIEMAIQQAASAMASKAAIATTTAAQVGSMTAIGAAAAAPAMATSVATAGGSAAAGMSGMTMAMLAVGGIMALAAGAGAFKDGGMLGGMGTGRSDSTLFWGSRGEMVMNRDAVTANQPMLQAMNNGASVGGAYIDNSVHVTVYYNKDGTATQDGAGNEFTNDMVRFIDSRVTKGITSSQKQGKSGY